ncbi:hypothetical protein B0H19DRAFT_1236953 [Mycena capillaripes]|nr:hypothetical protein B0H19DRAFT_1236953 [Mycena capillaripes]
MSDYLHCALETGKEMASDSGKQDFESYIEANLKLQKESVPGEIEWPLTPSLIVFPISIAPRANLAPLRPIVVVPPCPGLHGITLPVHDIKKMLRQAKQTAVEARPHQLTCEWNNCRDLVSSENGVLRNHLRDKHGVDGGKVPCRWTGCLSNKLMATNSIMNHLKSNQHLRWSLRCPFCPEPFAREDTLKRHLSGDRQAPDHYPLRKRAVDSSYCNFSFMALKG